MEGTIQIRTVRIVIGSFCCCTVFFWFWALGGEGRWDGMGWHMFVVRVTDRRGI